MCVYIVRLAARRAERLLRKAALLPHPAPLSSGLLRNKKSGETVPDCGGCFTPARENESIQLVTELSFLNGMASRGACGRLTARQGSTRAAHPSSHFVRTQGE